MGYTFGGWYKESTFTNLWNFSVDTVTADTILYAKLTINSYTVTFNSNGGSSVNTQTIDYGGTVIQPADPEKIEYTFVGWYKESTFTNLWNFSVDTVSSDKILYAKWAINSYTVTFNSNGGTAVDSQMIDYGGMITQPTSTTKIEYIFDGWYKESTLTDLWDFNLDTVITDITLYAKWNIATTAIWARSVTAGTNRSIFNSVAVDTSGNIYAAGYQYGTGSYTYGTGVSVAGTYSGPNVVLVKYDSSGTALWARSVSVGTNSSIFNSVAVDSSDYIYVAGEQYWYGSYTYGAGVSVAGPGSTNVVLVKYDTTGTALWARSVTGGGSNKSSFNSVAIDSSGNVYAAGYQYGSLSYGEGVTATGISEKSVVLVKYNSSGTALWATGLLSGTDVSYFKSITVDSLGNVYAAGYQYGTESYTYGTGVSVSGTYSGDNVVLVKYDSLGTALWAKSVSAGANNSYFNSVAIDSSGNVYTAGYQNGTGSFTYGTGASVSGTNSLHNAVLVKYDLTGSALWARSLSSVTNYSLFTSVSVNSFGNIYVAGVGNLAKYDSSGTTIWVKNVNSFNSVAVDSSGEIYTAGYQYGTESYTYGDEVSIAGTYAGGSNAVLVKYGAP